jgi:hypothetical protein
MLPAQMAARQQFRAMRSRATSMSDTRGTYSDGGPDDIPRTFRREREARERAAAVPVPDVPGYAHPQSYDAAFGSDVPAGVVKKIKVPFFSLMMFFMKAVLAAIPALLLLSVILWSAGQMLTKYFPWLLKMKIVISFPN